VISDEESEKEKCDTVDVGGGGGGSDSEAELDGSEILEQDSSDKEVEVGDDAPLCKKNADFTKTVNCMLRNYYICTYPCSQLL